MCICIFIFFLFSFNHASVLFVNKPLYVRAVLYGPEFVYNCTYSFSALNVILCVIIISYLFRYFSQENTVYEVKLSYLGWVARSHNCIMN